MRRAARRDANEPEIVAALQAMGWHVTKVSAPGFPDLVCIHRGVVVHLEVKMPGGKLEEAQVNLHEAWERAGCIVPVVTSVDEASVALHWVRTHGVTCCSKPRTYRDFAWEGVTAEQKARRLALSASTPPP